MIFLSAKKAFSLEYKKVIPNTRVQKESSEVLINQQQFSMFLMVCIFGTL